MGQFKRKTPISGKMKKVLLKEKNHRRAAKLTEDQEEGMRLPSVNEADQQPSLVGSFADDRYSTYTRSVKSINQQPHARGGGRNKFNLQFSSAKLDAEYEKGKREMYADIEIAQPGSLEYTSQDFFPEGLTFPERPAGYQSMSKEQLNMLENKSVRLYGEEMERLFSSEDINLYEQNVETWKQLWRVFDKSDVLLFIVDIRFAVCQFPPYVYRRLAEQGRGVVLVLNKVDLVPASVVLAWKIYFENLCSGIQVVPFCSHERILERSRKMRLALQSCRRLVEAVERAAPGTVDLSSWKNQLEREALISVHETIPTKPDQRRGFQFDFGDEDEDDAQEEPVDTTEDECPAPDEGSGVQGDGRAPRPFTIGTIGYPNVGKSSLINAIMGKYKVSVSRTPGHTKHFQTHFLTPNKDVMLCDCPGLIFPAICPYKLQVLSGTFPISQVRCPMSVLGFLASRINITRVLSLKPLEERHRDPLTPKAPAKWTPYAISEAWALKRQFHVKGRGGRLDTSRASNELLRLSLNAKNGLVLALQPQGYQTKKVALESMTEQISSIWLVQGLHANDAAHHARVLSFDSIPRGTKPEDAIARDIANTGRLSKAKRRKRKNMMAATLSFIGEDESELEEELSDHHQEEEDSDKSELEDRCVEQSSAESNMKSRSSSSKQSAVSNKFAALTLSHDEEESA